jgi:hypothetical protein
MLLAGRGGEGHGAAGTLNKNISRDWPLTAYRFPLPASRFPPPWIFFTGAVCGWIAYFAIVFLSLGPWSSSLRR